MSHKEHEAESKDVDDERRLRIYAKKYEMIVKQFDELIGIMTDSTTIKSRKRQRVSDSGEYTAGCSRQRENNEALLKTVTRFLHELGANSSDSK